jgi:hypothetical protein
VRRLLAEGLVDSYEKAELTASIQGEGFPREDALIAARECYSLDMALAYLQQECELCMAKVSASEVIKIYVCCKPPASTKLCSLAIRKRCTGCITIFSYLQGDSSI